MLFFSKKNPLLCAFFLMLFLSLAACGGSPTPATVTQPIVSATSTPVDKPTSTPKVADQVTIVQTAKPQADSVTPEPSPTAISVAPVSWAATVQTGYTVGWANTRSAPLTESSIVSSNAPGTAITLYGTTTGESLGAGTTWYRVSDQASTPAYIYAGLISLNKPATPTPTTTTPLPTATPTPPSGVVQLIDVNLTSQSLVAYENGKQVFSTLVTTGRPELATPTGTYHIYVKEADVTFISPWPKGSPYYYAPLHINYALEFLDGGFYIHDAPWRNGFGPGTEYPHTDTSGKQDTGSHGCVELPLSAAAWIYNWAQIGATVSIHA